MAGDGNVRLDRREAMGMEELVRQYIRSLRLAAPLNTRRIFAAWDEVSGAAQFTLKRFFRDGNLYITLGSSVIRSQLYYQKDALIEKINEKLKEDALYTRPKGDAGPVKNLILK